MLADFGSKLLQHIATQLPLSTSQKASVEGFRRQYAAEQDRIGSRGVSASNRDLNQWIAAMFNIVELGGSRDELVECYLDELEQLRQTGKSDVLFALVVEQIDDGKDVLGYRVSHRRGDIHPRHWANFESDLSALGAAPFLRMLMQDESSVPLQLAATVPDYDGFLDSFARSALELGQDLVASRRSEVRERFWMTAISLVSQSVDQSRLALLQVYRNIGTALIPNPGKGAGLEVRAADMLRIAYGLVDHQEAALSADLSEERKGMLLDLAPTIYSHDLMTPLTNINAFVELLVRDMNSFGAAAKKAPPDPTVLAPAVRAVSHLSYVSRDVSQLFRYLQAYASLEQTGATRWRLSQALDTVRELTRSNIDRLGFQLELQLPQDQDPELDFQQVYFVVVLMNLLMNAVHMMEKVPKDLRLGRIRISIKSVDGALTTWVLNTDTTIELSNRARIFRRGFSTRGGSGRGLHICKRVCTHVGGKLELLSAFELAQNQFESVFKVGFRFDVPLAGVATKKRDLPGRPRHNLKQG